jgi:glucosamine-phosphate N-acetyltransferase
MEIVINQLEKYDFQNYLVLMNQFRPVETDMTFDKFSEIYDKIFTYGEIYVARDENKIIGSITVIYEQKFIHHGAIYSHIEDVVVDKDYQSAGSKKGLKIGSRLIEYAKQKSMEKNCYKCTLVCSEELSPFYRKNQFEETGLHMTYSLISSEKPIEKHKPVHRENEWTGLTFESFQEMIKSELQHDMSADTKEMIPQKDFTNHVLEEQNREPEYYEKMFEIILNGTT